MEENLTRNDHPETPPESENEEQERNRWHRSNRPFRQNIDNSGHILDVLRAAMPYIDSRRQGTMETLMKVTDLIHTTRTLPEHTAELSAASLNTKAADIEGMLYSVREVGTIFERDMIDKLLNCIKARKFYRTYSTLNQNRDLLKAASIGNPNSTYGSNNSNFIEALKSILPADQVSNLDNIQMMLNAMNAMNTMGNHQNNTNQQANYNNQQNDNNWQNYNNNRQSYAREASPPPDVASNSNTTSNRPTPWDKSNDYSNIPNYTYQMSQGLQKNQSPEINSEYLNQFAPKVEAAAMNTTTSTNPMPQANSWNPTVPSTVNTPKMEPSTMNQLYNNITNIYNALNAAGLSHGSNPSSGNGNHPNSQANMMNAITALANSGMFSGNQSSLSQTNSTPPASTSSLTKPNMFHQQNMHNVPIPNARDFNTSMNQPQKGSKPFHPEAIYNQLSDFRQKNDWSHLPVKSQDTLEAASLDQQ